MSKTELERLNIPGYKINSFFSRESSRGGGTIILSKNCLNFRVLNFESLNKIKTEKEFEVCLVEFTIDSFNFVLLAVYRSPNSIVNNFLKNLM